MAKQLCDHLNKKVGKTNIEQMIKNRNEMIKEQAKGKVSSYTNWRMTGYNIVEFKRMLENLSIPKVDGDNLADFLDKNEDGFIT